MLHYTKRMTQELKSLLEQYIELFEYDPRGDMSFDLGYNLENEKDIGYKDLVDALKECVKNKKELYEYWDSDDDDDF